MVNCIKTKFKGTYHNDNIPVFDTLIWAISSGANISFTCGSVTTLVVNVTDDVVLKDSGGNTLCTEGNPYTISNTASDATFKIEGGASGGRILFKGKSSMGSNVVFPICFMPPVNEPNTLNPYKAIDSVSFDNGNNIGCTVSLEELVSSFPALSRLRIIPNSANITGSVSDLIPVKQTLTFLNVSPGTGLTGFSDIENFGGLTALSDLRLFTGLTGVMENFVRSQISNGRTTGSITLRFNAKGVTFNNVAVASAGSSSPKTLTWTSTTATYDGTTVNL